MKRLLCVLLLIAPTGLLAKGLEAVDDLGRTVRLESEPHRIISLAPHLTEILFSLGVGNRVVATVKYSDYPPAAKEIPRLGDAFSLSIEAIVDVAPDLVLAWSTGGNHRTLLQLKELGFAVYQNEAASLAGIAATTEKLGQLVGRPELGKQRAREFREGLDALSAARRPAPDKIKVFFQISDNQLYTVNNSHLIGQAMAVCGAKNIFGGLSIPVPMVSLESIVQADPDVILVASPQEGFRTRWAEEWQSLGWQDRIRYIDASLITRPGLRMLEGIKFMCESLNSAPGQ